MIGRRHLRILAGIILSSSLIASSFTAVLLAGFYSRVQYQTIGRICEEMIEAEPDMEQDVIAALKRYKNLPSAQTEQHILMDFGYRHSDFMKQGHRSAVLLSAAGCAAGSSLFLLVLFYWQKKEDSRIAELTAYLEHVNTGSAGLLPVEREDGFSRLQDELYKTVTMLHQTRDEAVRAKHGFAENLSNIAHQLKTPLTAISLSSQMMRANPSPAYLEQIEKQLKRLGHLEEALLLLSRLDAGTLLLEKEEADVFTLLTLAADNLQEMLLEAGVSVDIPEMGAVEIMADMDWTLEAVMNLLKNCMEYTPAGGTVHCSYQQNLLYTEIVIWDEGRGFSKEDIPHLFERFYRGKNAPKGGIGIGLSLSKEIIERQNGTLHARNMPGGGFEIRFYSH